MNKLVLVSVFLFVLAGASCRSQVDTPLVAEQTSSREPAQAATQPAAASTDAHPSVAAAEAPIATPPPSAEDTTPAPKVASAEQCSSAKAKEQLAEIMEARLINPPERVLRMVERAFESGCYERSSADRRVLAQVGIVAACDRKDREALRRFAAYAPSATIQTSCRSLTVD